MTPAKAAQLKRLVEGYGAVPKAQCALAITRVLQQVDGFESIGVTYFPNSLRRQFAKISGDEGRRITDDDADKNHNVLFDASL